MGLQQKVPARNTGYQSVNWLRQRVTFDGSAGIAYNSNRDGLGAGQFYLGTIPDGSIILGPIAGVDVNVAYNAGTNNRINIGIVGTLARWAANLALGTLGFVPMAVAAGHRVTGDTQVVVQFDVTGTAPTTGDVEVVLGYIPPNQ